MSSHSIPFEIQGHRGARGLRPENTIEGLRAAIALGVHTLELDVTVSADDVAIVCHDLSLNPDLVRDPSGRWLVAPTPLIREVRSAELRRFDVGRARPNSPIARAFPEQVACDGARMPTLAETVALGKAERVRLAVELKTEPGRPEAAMPIDRVVGVALDAIGQGAEIDLRAFDWRLLRLVAARRPDLPLTVLSSAKTEAEAELWWDLPAGTNPVEAIAREFPNATWAPEYRGLTEAQVAAARAAGLRVIPWTVNDPADMARLRAWGADGLCTDRPDLVRRS